MSQIIWRKLNPDETIDIGDYYCNFDPNRQDMPDNVHCTFYRANVSIGELVETRERAYPLWRPDLAKTTDVDCSVVLVADDGSLPIVGDRKIELEL